MIFNSQEFIIFFFIVVWFFYATPFKYRRLILLLASYIFYGWWNPAYLILIWASTLTDFFTAKKIYLSDNQKIKKVFLFFSILINLGILFSFKYANFVAETLNIVNEGNKLINILLPVGISFYTFQTMSYTIDVYKQKLKPEQKLINFALFVAFFPQLVAGPIERAQNILPQLKKNVKFDPDKLSIGIYLILLGLFQKVVVADNLAVFVDTIFNNPKSYKGIDVAIAAVFFAFQIYADFAGYTNIARGVALFFGVNLSVNFKQPYLANSIKNFWHRWHISLSTWFRDYVYIPLGGSKLPLPKWVIAISLTFILSGFWHGANWTFVVWGFLNAAIYVAEILLRKIFKRNSIKINQNHFVNLLRIFIAFWGVVLLWVIFRANTVSNAILIYKNLFYPKFSISFDHKWLILNFGLILSLVGIDLIANKHSFANWLHQNNTFIKAAFIYFFLLMIIFIGNWHHTPFIYFQF
ncbi:MAG: MBOAT family protein [Bacteroidales bacterium]|nr:MBOAT family protein [Bacteroidales bacterium]